MVSRGGDGGMAANQYVGQKGDAQSVTLDLKLISDIGFVGYVISKTSLDVKVLTRRGKIAISAHAQ